MAIRIFEPSILKAQGALLDLIGLYRRGGHQSELKLSADYQVLLRWQTSPLAGLPSEPFKIWRRPARPFAEAKKIRYEVINVDAFLPANAASLTVVQFAQPLASVRLQIKADNPGIARWADVWRAHAGIAGVHTIPATGRRGNHCHGVSFATDYQPGADQC